MTVVLAMLLDAVFGEPRWLWDRAPHPAVLMGRLIAWCDNRFNQGGQLRVKGFVLVIVLLVIATVIGTLIAAVPGYFLDVIIGAILLAQRSLVDHVRAVSNGLRLSLADGKRSVAMIVGRDTSEMDQTDVARAAIESAVENLSDGVTAPVFWFAVLGLPGLLIYKIINTADSMIGYLTPRHAEFGFAAAKLDDILNFIPARITALIIWVFYPRTAFSTIRSAAGLHRSPNAGWPEAATAYALNLALSGPRRYHGKLSDDPFVNPQGRKKLRPSDVDDVTRLLWLSWFVLLAFAILAGIAGQII